LTDQEDIRSLVISAPEPRTLELLFRPDALEDLRTRYDLRECGADEIEGLPDDVLVKARYIVGQPPISAALLDRLTSLRCVFNVEGNLMGNMPYDRLFERGIHVVTPGSVFALPVAELGLALALDLLRGVTDADVVFRKGHEVWGFEGNRNSRLLSGANVGLVGYGDLGRALHRLLEPFQTHVRVFDPWLPPSMIADAGADPASLEAALSESDVVFVVAGVTSENKGFLSQAEFSSMRQGAAFILLSRAEVVDFDALMSAVSSGHIVAASDVFPEEPMPPDHPIRTMNGFIRSAHRAGALDVAFFQMGDYLLEDMALLDRGLPPMRCRRAERETVAKLKSRPVSLS
jgi:phosphoglycerate dehydrogenase-like enzyme